MTLYWWMHWFWVTAQIAGCTVVAPSSPATESAIENVTVTPTELASKQGFPFAKTVDHYTNKTIVTLNRPVVPPKVIGINAVNLSNRTRNNTFNNVTQFHPENRSTEKAGSITKPYTYKKEIMFKNASKSVRLKQEESNKNLTREESLAVVPLNVDNSSTSNTSNFKIWNGTANNSNNQINGKYTEKLVVASVSPSSTEESSRSNRARGTLFSIGLPREQTHQDKQFSKFSNDESPVGMYSGNGTSPTDIAIITLSCLAIVVLLSMAGSFGFIMYRRKYLNPPQTLNSDKCSNPDSSGYIDDSTIRDNSEEMYSLDNDSFLNSLEAMTIQNYWTDSVKHTKL